VPQPHVYVIFLNGPALVEGKKVKGEIHCVIRNGGPGVASDLFMNIEVGAPAGGSSQIAIQPADQQNWSIVRSFGYHFSFMAKDNVRLPPEAQLSTATIQYQLEKPFTSNLEMKIMTGAAGSMPHRYSCDRPPSRLDELYAAIISSWPHQELRDAASKRFSMNLMADEETPIAYQIVGADASGHAGTVVQAGTDCGPESYSAAQLNSMLGAFSL